MFFKLSDPVLWRVARRDSDFGRAGEPSRTATRSVETCQLGCNQILWGCSRIRQTSGFATPRILANSATPTPPENLVMPAAGLAPKYIRCAQREAGSFSLIHYTGHLLQTMDGCLK